MEREIIFRALFILTLIAMMAIRVYYQSKILRDKKGIEIKEGSVSLIAGSIAALTSIVFGMDTSSSRVFSRLPMCCAIRIG
jgi:hypothetical protein